MVPLTRASALARPAPALFALALAAAPAAGEAQGAQGAAIQTLAARALDPTGAGARALTLEMRPHESLAAALARAGVSREDAKAARTALLAAFDADGPHPGLSLKITLAAARPAMAGGMLTGLMFAPEDGGRLGLSREADGDLHLRRFEAAPVFAAPTIKLGSVKGSLYESIVASGVDPEMAARITGLFGRRLDLVRDVREGDRFRLVFDRQGAQAGAGDRGELLYADIATKAGVARLYRYQPAGAARAEWVDGDGDPRKAGLLRTPLEALRVTSTFGMRQHPLLGYTRMHQGVDFGAPEGTPVYAAADGVVEEARWDGGYGRWLKIRHGPALETGYAHLSGWAVTPGTTVRQGQVVGYVGETGLATGPHLHFEVFRSGRRIDPARTPVLSRAARDIAADPAFRARKAGIDAVVASLSAQCAEPGLFAGRPAARCIG